jgi:hypothetical protein
MPLQDHFHPPLSSRRHWQAFHNSWATYLSSQLNQKLPQGYFAEANVQFGIEIDVASFQEPTSDPGENTTIAGRLPMDWAPPAPNASVAFTALEENVEIVIFGKETGPILAGAIELISPGNKDRPAHRDAFIHKCAYYLQSGIGLIVVDVVTDRRAQLHQELMEKLQSPIPELLPADLYAVAYRPLRRENQTQLDIWSVPLTIGNSLPVLPLWLRGEICLPVDFETAYERTCLEQRIRAEGA